jgi:cytochrome c551/c552
MRNTLRMTTALLAMRLLWPEPGQGAGSAHAAAESIFQTSDRCFACHNGLSTATGEDISIGFEWRASMMANSSRDPYWQAGVRREALDHPESRAAIEDECAVCHMPMSRYVASVKGQHGEVFSHLMFDPEKPDDRLAMDGVSCSVCHQITKDRLGTRESFVGRFVIDEKTPRGERPVYGPFQIEAGQTRIMRTSSGGFRPTESQHIQQSELCATCHTLYTKALGPGGKVVGELPEQVPYQEWLNSEYRDKQSCQSCHMPVVEENVPIAKVLGKPREGFSRHDFIGANFFMQRMLNRYRNELSVAALPQELAAAAERTVQHLQSRSARILVDRIETRGSRLGFEVMVENLAGHKLPTAYPSRRAWLHVTVRSGNRIVFESGALGADAQIQGNDNDADASRFEPHYNQITRADQVQICAICQGQPPAAARVRQA